MGVSEMRERWTQAEAMCPHRLVLEHVTSRWGVLVLDALLDRSYRFSELRRHIGTLANVSEKMLTQTLQTLERDGFVHRDAKPVIPPRVDYSLTPLGREAAERVRALAHWTGLRMDDVEQARAAYDEKKRRAETDQQAAASLPA
ncbi:helix-turn-helix transcriptional regulator [Streptomyces sp. NBC_00193]|uniref:winged helix-turn-helix transcriptional regulator n=1 Tax=Streptomyces sp. NBC_00193 TaxID=2975675 RepID=UPI00224E0D1E|nr:helix-turn-helix domain-containing protein [Streptomyces sp. NBC_00193]MCX5298768.1 helix-turn-helix transcriptional regulator [Streptomyces sp. NBC_00193]